jgi:uncharacterized protein YndB with AHSA1/START domain
MTNALILKAEPGQSFIEFTREFDAPVDAVFRAHAEPDLLKQWLGPRDYDTEIERYDFRTGGSYRYLQRDGENVYAFHGVFHVVRENDFAVQTFEFEGVPDVVSLDSMHFEDLGGGRTRLSGRSAFPSLEAAQGMIASGMERGMAEGYERLDELLTKS